MTGKFKKTTLTIWQANHNSETRRADVVAERTRMETRTWERIRFLTDWMDMLNLYADPGSLEARQTRRYMHRLRRAGIVEIRYVWDGWDCPRRAQFRVLLKSLES
ncbi:MAG: hypothetical protein PHC88_05490 [Terrimicrobiaceae bacterium]|nr:hypothetical protein [Terrimicrobiaceae bacterium]